MALLEGCGKGTDVDRFVASPDPLQALPKPMSFGFTEVAR
jgi:hypothetical protein